MAVVARQRQEGKAKTGSMAAAFESGWWRGQEVGTGGVGCSIKAKTGGGRGRRKTRSGGARRCKMVAATQARRGRRKSKLDSLFNMHS